MYEELTGSDKIERNPPLVRTKDQMEIWWDKRVKTTTKVENNRPEIIWRSYKQLCQIVEITVPLDTNLRNAYKQKYTPHIANMPRMYKGYRYELKIITVEAMGTITKTLDDSLRKLNLIKIKLEVLQSDYKRQHLLGQ